MICHFCSLFVFISLFVFVYLQHVQNFWWFSWRLPRTRAGLWIDEAQWSRLLHHSRVMFWFACFSVVFYNHEIYMRRKLWCLRLTVCHFHVQNCYYLTMFCTFCFALFYVHVQKCYYLTMFCTFCFALVLHLFCTFLFHCTFYSYFSFSYHMYALVLCYLYNLYSYCFALSTERTWFDCISLLVMPCITIMWQNKETLTLTLTYAKVKFFILWHL